MRIVFGWNSFRLKSYSLPELGISNEDAPNVTVEIRQRYFHLFWIPFFSIGKIWAMRRDGSLYEVPDPILPFIPAQRPRTPWYTFIGPLLVLAGLALYGIYEEVRHAREMASAKQRFDKEVALLDAHFKKTDTTDYYKLRSYGTHLSDRIVLLKVKQVDTDSILFSRIVTGLSEYELAPMRVHTLFQENPNEDHITISKDSLNRAVNRQFEDQVTGAQLFTDGQSMVVTEINHLDGPLLKNRGTGRYGVGVLDMDILNYGYPASVTRIRNIKGKVNWETTELPQEVASATNDSDYRGMIRLSGTNYSAADEYAFGLYLVDATAKEHKYLFKGRNLDCEIIQVY